MLGDYGLPRPWYFPFTWTYWCAAPAFEEDEGCYQRLPPWLKNTLVRMGCIHFKSVIDDLLKDIKSDHECKYN